MFLLRNYLCIFILFVFLDTFSFIKSSTPADGTYGGKCKRSGLNCMDNMLSCYYDTSDALEGTCLCKPGTSYIEGKGCQWMGTLHGLCNETIKCSSYHTKCSKKTGNGVCVCDRFYDTINDQYNCDRIDSNGMLGGQCGEIENTNYECTDAFTECVHLTKTYSECRCMKGYRTNPDTYQCEKVQNGMLTSKCSSSNPCTDENTICSSKDGEGICICDYLNHYVMSNIQICEISSGFAKECNNADDCYNFVQYTCSDGLCLCSENYEINENYTECEYKPPVTEDTSNNNNNSCYNLIRYLCFILLILL
jgi:hypothetical protein